MKNHLKMRTFVIFTHFLTNEIKILLLYKAKKWDFFFSTLCLFLENVFINRHFCFILSFFRHFYINMSITIQKLYT